MNPLQDNADRNPPLTHHGRKRGKERAGLDAKALQRTAAKALNVGLRPDETKSALRRYLDGLANGFPGCMQRIHGNHIFCFAGRGVLNTVYWLPREHRKAAAAALQKRGGVK
jgi:hypothetical protein